ncbi:putative neural-cadherin 2, partial [Penaeus monodon]|uniref:putative neural-cadherin 2 n=1 Tax=Penaeus monodon TaxID=6687 RepID=UPI0018A70B73
SEVTYSVVAGGVGGVFVVDARAGGLTLTTPLDFEARQSYEVVVEGQAGVERAYAHVMVLVTDVNDEPPAFSRPLYETQITEEDDRHLPKPILQVAAVDRDASDEGRLRYMLRGRRRRRRRRQQVLHQRDVRPHPAAQGRIAALIIGLLVSLSICQSVFTLICICVYLYKYIY